MALHLRDYQIVCTAILRVEHHARALLRAGADALHEQALDVGYAQLASDFDDLSADADRRVARDRHAQRIPDSNEGGA